MKFVVSTLFMLAHSVVSFALCPSAQLRLNASTSVDYQKAEKKSPKESNNAEKYAKNKKQ